MPKGPKGPAAGQQEDLRLDHKPTPATSTKRVVKPVWHVLLPPALQDRVDEMHEEIERAAKVTGMSYPQMIEWLVRDALDRLDRERRERERAVAEVAKGARVS